MAEEPSASQSKKPASGKPGKSEFKRKERRPEDYLPENYRQLPQSMDAEKGVLCSAFLAPKSVLDMCVEQKVTKEHFHFPSHATLYQTLLEFLDQNKPVDLITVTQELSDKGKLDQVGGPGGLADIFTFIPTATNADYYINILQQKFLLRQMILTCTEFASRCYDEQGEVRELLDEVEKRVLAIGEQRFQGELPTLKDEVMAAITNIEHLYQNRGGITGLPTGFKKLDEMTSGLHESEMIIIAARPSMGKTAFAMNIAEHVAVDLGKPVAIFSLEMSTQQLVQRLLCSRARMNLQKIRDGFLQKSDFPKLTAAAAQLSKSNIFIDDTPGLSILEMRSKARRLHQQHRIELIVVDYLQLLRSTSRRAQENRQIEVSEISYGLKALAKELKLPIIVLAQLNRQPDEKGGRPMLSHLRESGSIEQDADVVGMLFRAEVYEKDEEAREAKSGEAELIIAKQRNGPVGDIPLTFLKEFTRFENRATEARE